MTFTLVDSDENAATASGLNGRPIRPIVDTAILSTRNLGFALLAHSTGHDVAALLRPLIEADDGFRRGDTSSHPATPLVASVLVDALLAAGIAVESRNICKQLDLAAPTGAAAAFAAGRSRLEYRIAISAGSRPTADDETLELLSWLEGRVVDTSLDLLERARVALTIGRSWRYLRENTTASSWLGAASNLFTVANQPAWAAVARRESSEAPSTNEQNVRETRERQVAELIRLGMTNREIASELHVSVKTVEAVLSALYKRFGYRGRHQLALDAPFASR